MTGPEGPTGPEGNVSPRSISIEAPTATENVTLFYTFEALTVTGLAGVIRGGTSVNYTVRYDGSRAGTGTELVTGGLTADSTTTGNITTTFTNDTIPANSFVWIETTAVTGAVQELSVSLRYDA